MDPDTAITIFVALPLVILALGFVFFLRKQRKSQKRAIDYHEKH